MISYDYRKDSFPTFQEGIRREWAMTNGIGGYAGSSLIGAHNRTHQGYLIASLHPPTSRYLVFSKINETLRTADTVCSLETAQHRSGGHTCYREGQQYLEHFSYDGSIHYDYQAKGISLRKHICLKQGENVCAVAYEAVNDGPDAILTLVPLFNFREHSSLSRPETLAFETHYQDRSLMLIPASHPDLAVWFQISDGEFEKNPVPYDVDMQLQTEVDLETEGLDSHYCPVVIKILLPMGARKKISVICQVCAASEKLSPISGETAFGLLKERRLYTDALISAAGYQDDFADRLVLAGDQFLSFRKSTGLKTILAGLPWFTDWGRDTMIAFTGLTLCTGRIKEAEEILLTFSKYIKDGIVPNMFPDNNTKPLYNTADASLWYFYAVWQYLNYTDTSEAYSFIEREIYPHLKEIIAAYRDGTDFCIYMDEDGLIHAGSGLDQITWMDVRVGEWVVTPRHGKPVEINALWYNALKVMESLAKRFGETDANDSAYYRSLAERTKASFRKKFWNEDVGCLYDVIDGGDVDDHLRPNQIYAVSLPFTMLDREQELRIVSIVKRELYIGCGLRSLSSGHKDYHGIYSGSLPKRDAAYHQGTAWGFLLGGFLTAFLKVHDHSKFSILESLAMLEPIKKHLFQNGCIGSISEIFDGDAPHNPRGCYAQAWSVGEILRAYTQDILPYIK